MSRTLILATALAVALSACTSSDQTPATGDASTASTNTMTEAMVHIMAPANGDTVTQPFTVSLSAMGVEVVPVNGIVESGRGHHHLIIDHDVPADTLPLPPAPVVIHMGDGSHDKVIEGLNPGPHRIIAVFADGMHVPMASVRPDTITVVVR